MANARGIGCGVLGAIFLFAIIATAGRHAPTTGKPDPSATDTPKPAAADPHQAELELQQKTALTAGEALKSSARDPDSLVIEQGLASADGKLLCVRYRARNGFGGMNRDAVAFFNSVPHDSAAFWNSHCANRSLEDVTDNVKLGASMAN